MSADLVVTMTRAELAALIADAVAAALEGYTPRAPSEVLDRMGAAELLGVSLPTLRKLVLEGHVVERRLGDAPRYLRSELLEALRQPATSAGAPRLIAAGNAGESGGSVHRVLSERVSPRNR